MDFFIVHLSPKAILACIFFIPPLIGIILIYFYVRYSFNQIEKSVHDDYEE